MAEDAVTCEHFSALKQIFETLIAKTFAILGYQLLLTYLSRMVVVNYAKRLHGLGSDAVVESRGKTGDLKLVLATPGIVFALLILDVMLRGEGRRLQARVEFFNLFNHPNFDLPDRIFDSGTFARLRSANGQGNKPPRQIQLGLRYAF